MKIENAQQIERKGVSMFVYADAGVGKTSLAKTLANPLVIDIDGGMAVLKGADLDYVTVLKSLKNLSEVFDSLESMDKYPSIFLDSVSELEKMMLIDHGKRSKNHGAPTQNDYNIVYFKERDYIRRFRDLREKGIDVIATALEMPLELEQFEGVVRTRMYPMMGKKLSPEICGLFDVVAHMEISTKPGFEGDRYLRLQPTEQIAAKNRLTDDQFWPADLGSFIEKVRPKE